MRSEYLYKIGDVINENLEVLEYKTISMKTKKTKSGETYRKGYLIKCLRCGYIHEKSEASLKKGSNCSCCCNPPRICVKGINDIATTHPYLVKYFVNSEDTYTHTYASGKKCLMKCPDCGFEKWMTIDKLSERGFSCNQCGDGISYPNKFITNILTQLGVDFELEKTFNWGNKRKYDIYIPSLNIIIENHGIQHYKNGFENCGGRSLEEERENDRVKRELALNNDIKFYIELDCSISELEWIKQSVIDSGIPKILNFKEEDIDWIKCDKYSTKSLVVRACELWNSGIKSTTKIAEILKIHSATVNRYLKQGRKFNMVDYNTKEIMKYNGKKAGEKVRKRVYMYDLDMNFIGEFESCSELERQSEELFGIKLHNNNISSVCTGKQIQHKGYIFSYTKLEE